MIPTVIIVNDDNPQLEELEELLSNFTRTLRRNSIQGEQLYGMFEGVIFCDSEGNFAVKRRDNYQGLALELVTRLASADQRYQGQLRTYLDKKDEKNPSPRIHFLKELEEGKWEDHFPEVSFTIVEKFMETFFIKDE